MKPGPNPLDAHALSAASRAQIDPDILNRVLKVIAKEPIQNETVNLIDENLEEEIDDTNAIYKEIEDDIDKTGKKFDFSKCATRIAEETSDVANSAPEIEIKARKALMLKIQPFIQKSLESISEKTSDEEKPTIVDRIENKQMDFGAEIGTSLRHGSPELGFFQRWWNGPINEGEKFKAGIHDAATLFLKAHFKMPIIDPEQEQKIEETVKKAVEYVGKKKNLIAQDVSL